METRKRRIVHYLTQLRRDPFADWFDRFKARKAKATILNRLDRVEMGNFGDCKPVGNGVNELRIDYGPGYRIYFGLDEDKVVLLGGGDKSTQQADIAACMERWRDYNA